MRTGFRVKTFPVHMNRFHVAEALRADGIDAEATDCPERWLIVVGGVVKCEKGIFTVTLGLPPIEEAAKVISDEAALAGWHGGTVETVWRLGVEAYKAAKAQGASFPNE